MKADRSKVEQLLRTARGQLEGVMKMIDDDRYCMDILAQLQALEALMRKAKQEVLRTHLLGCVQEAFDAGDLKLRDEKIGEIVRLIDKN